MTNSSSGTYAFDPTFITMATAAYRIIGAIAEDETPTAGMLSDALIAGNSMLKEWIASGIHIWTTQEAILFLQQGQYRYLLGTGLTASPPTRCCDAWSYSFSQLNSTANAAATVLTLQSVVGYAAGQNVGVVLDTGETFWTTQVGAPSGNNITLAAGLPSQASANNFVYTFAQSATIQSPLRVPNGRMLQWNGLIEVPMIRLSRSDYMNYPNKATLGTPTQYYYDPNVQNGVPQGVMYVYTNPSSPAWGMRFTYMRPLQDITTNPTQVLDLPIEWVNTFQWNLAREMAPQFDLPPQRWAMLKEQADEKLEMVRGWDREPEDVNMVFSFDSTDRG